MGIIVVAVDQRQLFGLLAPPCFANLVVYLSSPGYKSLPEAIFERLMMTGGAAAAGFTTRITRAEKANGTRFSPVPIRGHWRCRKRGQKEGCSIKNLSF